MDKLLSLIIIISAILLGLIIINYTNTPETPSLIVEYASKPRCNYKHRVVVSMWADKKNVNTVDKTLESILKQNVKVDMIYLNLSPNTQLDKESIAHQCAIISKSKIDYPASDVPYPTLVREKDARTVIVEVKPGDMYNPDFIEKALNSRTKEGYILYHVNYLNENKSKLPVAFMTGIIDPMNPGILNQLLSHNLE
jgi:hypothetical protein